MISGYRYLVSGQFNIISNRELVVNLHILHTNLWTIPLFKKKVQGKDSFMVGSTFYFVKGYNYNSGEQYSRSNKITNPYIQFTLLKETIKIHVMIYIRGAVQLRASYIDAENRSIELDINVLQEVYLFLRQLFIEIVGYSLDSGYEIVTNELKPEKKSKITNMVDGKQPQLCHNRPGTKPGSGEYRPVPYSFYGTCPMEGYYVKGIKRPDGKYEPCCRKLKVDPSSPDYVGRYKNIILNGYPDAKAGLFGENVTPGDSAVFVPGTKIVEPRSHPGLNNMSRQQLMSCMENSGYLRNLNTFDEYNSFKRSVNVPKVTFKKRKPLLDLSIFTKNAYLVTPINNDTLRVKLYFDKTGVSYFINEFGDVSETGIPVIPELQQTTIEGYLYPYIEPQFIFYPSDISIYNGKDVSQLDYYFSAQKRWDYLNKAVQLIQSQTLQIEMRFDLNIIQGSRYFLTNFQEVSGLLFIPFKGNQQRIWSDVIHDDNLTISLQAQRVKANRWKISVDNKTLPGNLIQQGHDNDIELPVAFTKNRGEQFIVLCKINLKRTDFKIENRKPITPIEIIDSHINSYNDVVNILESINNPISRETFVTLNQDPLGFSFRGNVYYLTSIGEPLKS
jgi:hypothetical protein